MFFRLETEKLKEQLKKNALLKEIEQINFDHFDSDRLEKILKLIKELK